MARERERGGAAKLALGSSIDILSYNYDSRISFVEMKNTIPQNLEKGNWNNEGNAKLGGTVR